MAAGQALLAGRSRKGAGEQERAARRAYPTLGEAAAVGAAAADAAEMPAGWKPSRFFEAWKTAAVGTAGALYWNRMTSFRGFTPDDRREAIDAIIRSTMVRTYRTDDFYEGFDASHNDYDAMEAYAAAFLDAFWEEFWAEWRADHPDMVAANGGGRALGAAPGPVGSASGP